MKKKAKALGIMFILLSAKASDMGATLTIANREIRPVFFHGRASRFKREDEEAAAE